MKTYNMDVAGVVARLRRFRFETVKAASSGLASVSAADFARAKSYLMALGTYLDWVIAQPQLDLPELSPREIDMGEADKVDMPENEALVDMMRLYDAAEYEIAHSQSSRQSTGLISHDEQRIRNIILKMDSMLDNYISIIQPLDLPESAPKRGMTGEGRTGI